MLFDAMQLQLTLGISFVYIVLLLFSSCAIRVRIGFQNHFFVVQGDLIVWSFGGEDLKVCSASLVMVTSPHECNMSSGILNITQYVYSLYYPFIESCDEHHYHCEHPFISLFHQFILAKKQIYKNNIL